MEPMLPPWEFNDCKSENNIKYQGLHAEEKPSMQNYSIDRGQAIDSINSSFSQRHIKSEQTDKVSKDIELLSDGIVNVSSYLSKVEQHILDESDMDNKVLTIRMGFFHHAGKFNLFPPDTDKPLSTRV